MRKRAPQLLLASIAGLLAPVFAFAAVAPNDPFYAEEQAADFNQIQLPGAWDLTTGSRGVIIAVIDAGTDTDHPDLIGNMWFNRGEKPLNGIDDDQNGYVDDLNGWDFLDEVSDPHPKFGNGYTFGGANHGTTVAGVAAAATNNGIGLAGVCWTCKIMALRALDSNGEGDTAHIAKAIDYAVANGADIINMSFVGALTDAALSDAVARAYEAGVILVAAVGNDADSGFIAGDLDFRPLYPVCLDGGANRVLGVGSLGSNNAKSDFSNYGFSCIDINTPGDGIAGPQLYDPALGKDFENRYRGGWQGTSVAAPIASGVAGLMKSINPTLSNSQVISIVRETAINIDRANGIYGGQLGAGLLNAAAAVKKAAETAGDGSKRTASPARSAISQAPKRILASSGQNRTVDVRMSGPGGEGAFSWRAYPAFFRGGAEVVSGDVDGDGELEIITGAGGGGGPQVRIFNTRGEVEGQFFAYDSHFRGGVHVAVADFDKDGIDEIVASAGSGLSSEVKIVDKGGAIKWSFKVTADGLVGGVTVQAADIDKDGEVEVITGTGGGSLPLVQIFDKMGVQEASWLAYPKFFRGGLNVAVGDVDGDGALEVVTAAGFGGGPQVRVFSSNGDVETQFFAFEPSFRGGTNLAVGNVDADATAEIIAGSGRGRATEVRVFSKFGVDFAQDSVFKVFEDGYKGGVNVGT
ncbi:MAG: S8 family serine peptidase [Parcubacteria group bacterium]|nr:S8 family serine peptidase [Parcubacteria group bacterium]